MENSEENKNEFEEKKSSSDNTKSDTNPEIKSMEDKVNSIGENNVLNEANNLADGITDEYNEDVLKLAEAVDKIRKETAKVIIGQDDVMTYLLIGLFTGGNVLLEGVPGVAKTLFARMLAKSIATDFTRIQFTPDLMPSDIIGTMIFNVKNSEFEFKSGPIFSNIILIDEINRAPAKTQAALMEVMEEKQITVEGKKHKMGFPFFVIATQNPVEQEGTYKLPEAQMDRFLFKIKVDYPELEDERKILMRFKSDFKGKVQDSVNAVLNVKELQKCQEIIENIYIKDELINYIAEIVVSTRKNADLYLGASPRASLAILKASKAFAMMNGRTFVTPDDIKFVSPAVLNHRIILSHEREMEGQEAEDVIKELIEEITVPR
ncbi:MAG: MoxR-like ATPase [Patiriisocius sp.]|jgi:MoxR-like ATPase